MKTENKEFPILTLEKLAILERKLEMQLATLEDLELIEHYLTSIDMNDMKEEFRKEGLYSLEEYFYLLKVDRYPERLRAASITGYLLGSVHGLQDLVQDGQKIY
ncbi:MAG TPA: hypothetical protein VFE50_08970 [Cyclobacteriaceae bacterium]|nr:hypothetical protein [Cyclobacteriaceae bacterium]